MLTTVRPLTRNSMLQRNKSSLVVLEYDCFEYNANVMLKTELEEVILCIMKDIMTTKEVLYEAKWVACAWFKYVISQTITNATYSPRFFMNKYGSQSSTIASEDIVWSIQNLPRVTYFQALAYCFHEVVVVQGNKNEKAEILKILNSGLHEVRKQCSIKKFSFTCWNSLEGDNSLDFHTLSSKGIIVLLSWVKKIASLTLNKAAEDLEKKKKISSGDMMRAFNWVRLEKLQSLSLDVQDLKNGCILTDLKRMSQKEFDGLIMPDSEPLPYFPGDLLQSHVLPHLHYDSLSRFKCVCKDWKKTISSHHCQRLLENQNQSYGIFLGGDQSLMLEEVSKCHDVEIVAIDTTSVLDLCKANFYASCNGLLCLVCASTSKNPSCCTFAIGNPLIGEWTSIMSPDFYSSSEYYFKNKGPGLAVNLSNNPPWYKLIIHVRRSGFGQERAFGIFSSETGEWTKSNAIDPQYNLQRKGNSVYVDGILYWVRIDEKLCWYDIDRDVVGSIILPRVLVDEFAIGSLKQLWGEERLTCSFVVDDIYTTTVETYGLVGQNQWEKLHSICVGDYGNVHPFPYLGWEQQLVGENNSIVAYNVRSHKRRVVIKSSGDKFDVELFGFKMNTSSFPKRFRIESWRKLYW